MGLSTKLMFFLLISMVVVSIVRCQKEEYEEIETYNQNNGPVDPSSATPTDGKKGFKDCVKEKVKKVVDKGKELIKGAGDAISKGYNSIKEKIGKKQPDSMSTSTPVNQYHFQTSDFEQENPSSGVFPPPPSVPDNSVLPSGQVPPQFQQDSTSSQSKTNNDVEFLGDPRLGNKKK